MSITPTARCGRPHKMQSTTDVRVPGLPQLTIDARAIGRIRAASAAAGAARCWLRPRGYPSACSSTVKPVTAYWSAVSAFVFAESEVSL
jgi:hypothetical protein